MVLTLPGNRPVEHYPRLLRRAGLACAVLALLSILLAQVPSHAQSENPPPHIPNSQGDTNFSQFPGFEAYLRANPPSDDVPTAADRELLARYKPRLFLSAGGDRPLDFYADYIAHGWLYDEAGALISDKVDQSLLNAVKLRPSVSFVHAPADRPVTPTLYGRIDRIDTPIRLAFLTYHAVFRHSGLPAGVPNWQTALLSLVADPDDWHQLDHYTAVSVVLAGPGQPLAVMLQQHNYLRTYLVGEDIVWPRDDRIAIDVAVRSNELYPHAPGWRRHRAVRFITPEALDYMLGFGDAPFPSADDITDPAGEVETRLDYLAPSDAFYVFRGFLGERRILPGRDGPPGAFYNTLPPLKPLHLQLGAGYWRPGSEADRARALAAQREHGDNWRQHWARAQLEVLFENADCLRPQRIACALD